MLWQRKTNGVNELFEQRSHLFEKMWYIQTIRLIHCPIMTSVSEMPVAPSKITKTLLCVSHQAPSELSPEESIDSPLKLIFFFFFFLPISRLSAILSTWPSCHSCPPPLAWCSRPPPHPPLPSSRPAGRCPQPRRPWAQPPLPSTCPESGQFLWGRWLWPPPTSPAGLEKKKCLKENYCSHSTKLI